MYVCMWVNTGVVDGQATMLGDAGSTLKAFRRVEREKEEWARERVRFEVESEKGPGWAFRFRLPRQRCSAQDIQAAVLQLPRPFRAAYLLEKTSREVVQLCDAVGDSLVARRRSIDPGARRGRRAAAMGGGSEEGAKYMGRASRGLRRAVVAPAGGRAAPLRARGPRGQRVGLGGLDPLRAVGLSLFLDV